MRVEKSELKQRWVLIFAFVGWGGEGDTGVPVTIKIVTMLVSCGLDLLPKRGKLARLGARKERVEVAVATGGRGGEGEEGKWRGGIFQKWERPVQISLPPPPPPHSLS